MHFRDVLFFTVLVLGVAQGEPAQSADPVSHEKQVTVDSLQARASALESEAAALEGQLESLSGGDSVDSRDGLANELARLEKELGAVRELVNGAFEEVYEQLTETKAYIDEKVEAESGETDALRPQRRHAGACVVTFEYAHLDMDPIKKFLRTDISLKDKEFSQLSNQIMMVGLMGYYSTENNVRIGNGIFGGYKSYQSEVYAQMKLDSLGDEIGLVDSLVTLRVIPVYAGFICEKAFVYDVVTFYGGMMLGGNMTIIVKEEQEYHQNSLFFGTDEDRKGAVSVAFAPAVAWDFHGGFTVSLAKYVHLGIDGVMRFAYAYEGFGPYFGDFLSVSPVVRLRLSFGSAG